MVAGEHYRDQFTYTPAMLAELVPMALDGPEPPAKGLSDTPGGGGDPAEGGNVQAMLIDVRRAVPALDPEARVALGEAYVTGRDVPLHVLRQLADIVNGDV